jgi:hypothetical protein
MFGFGNTIYLMLLTSWHLLLRHSPSQLAASMFVVSMIALSYIKSNLVSPKWVQAPRVSVNGTGVHWVLAESRPRVKYGVGFVVRLILDGL